MAGALSVAWVGVGSEMLAQPDGPAARTAGQDLIAKAAQRPELRQVGGQLADRVIELHLQAGRMHLVDVRLQVRHAQKRVIDE